MREKEQFPVRAVAALLGFAGLMVLLSWPLSNAGPDRITYSDFLNKALANQFSAIQIADTELIGALKTDAGKSAETLQRVATSRPAGMDESWLLKELATKGIEISVTRKSTTLLETFFTWFFPVLLFMLILSMMSRNTRPSVTGVGKSKAKIYDQYTQSTVRFTDVAGVDEAEAELIEVVDFLKNPQKYTRLGGRIPKGVLLVGPPGTGKTLLAKAVAGEAGVPFFSISGSEFMEIFVGVGAARVRDLFDQAKQRAPCIIFIDELDAIGKSRSSGRGMLFNNEEREQTLNQLLAEMDGFDTSSGVIIMAATNTPEVLDKALMRAGRFDRQIIVDRPDIDGREAILKLHAGKVQLGASADLHVTAERTPGMAGADLANIINEAALLAARRQGERVEMYDLEEAIDRVMLGLEKKTRVMSSPEKERVAYHEAGHALVALSMEHADPVHRVSIIPRTIGALGHTLQLPTEERFLMTKSELLDQISVMLGGRGAEELVFKGEISTGAADDLERASELARQMVTRFGMSERLGSRTYGRQLGGRFLPNPFGGEEQNYSEKTAEAIDEEVQRIIEECFGRSRKVLTDQRERLERISRELIRRETLDRDSLRRLLRDPVPAEQESQCSPA